MTIFILLQILVIMITINYDINYGKQTNPFGQVQEHLARLVYLCDRLDLLDLQSHECYG